MTTYSGSVSNSVSVVSVEMSDTAAVGVVSSHDSIGCASPTWEIPPIGVGTTVDIVYTIWRNQAPLSTNAATVEWTGVGESGDIVKTTDGSVIVFGNTLVVHLDASEISELPENGVLAYSALITTADSHQYSIAGDLPIAEFDVAAVDPMRSYDVVGCAGGLSSAFEMAQAVDIRSYDSVSCALSKLSEIARAFTVSIPSYDTIGCAEGYAGAGALIAGIIGEHDDIGCASLSSAWEVTSAVSINEYDEIVCPVVLTSNADVMVDAGVEIYIAHVSRTGSATIQVGTAATVDWVARNTSGTAVITKSTTDGSILTYGNNVLVYLASTDLAVPGSLRYTATITMDADSYLITGVLSIAALDALAIPAELAGGITTPLFLIGYVPDELLRRNE